MPPYERIRAGMRRTYQSSLLFRDLTVRDNLFLAVRGVSRGRFNFLRAGRGSTTRAAAEDLLERVRLTHVGDETVASLSHGQQRQLEVGMALAGAPRLILFDEPAAGLSPAERRELVALLAALPAHMSFILIEHDLEIALRVVDRVTVMHNGRMLKEGTPGRDRERSRSAGDLHGPGGARMSSVTADPGDRLLAIERLDVHYGRAHALQQVSLTLDQGVLAVVGRNGMGKTTLCNAITGLVRATGSIRFLGQEMIGLPANAITRLGIGYVPQGRRVWPSLTVDEHLRLAARSSKGPWTVERAYRTFPRLAERKANGGAELSGGEQQMLAIARALLFNPRLLVMDEPTEGLAPVIVQQVEAMLKSLAADGEIAVLLIEQNLGVAIAVADTVNVMVNGRIARSMPVAELAADRALQQRLLGVKCRGRRGRSRRRPQPEPASRGGARCSPCGAPRPSALPACRDRRARGARLYALGHRGATIDRRVAPVAGHVRPEVAPRWQSAAASRRVPGRGQHRARRIRRGHVRHQGSRTGLSCATASRSSACAW